MNEWAQAGRRILQSRQDLDPEERALMEVHVRAVELAGGLVVQRPIGLQEAAVVCERDLLDAEWQRQAGIRVARGFHVAAGFPDTDEGKKVFLDSLAKFEPQPEGYKGRFDAPRLVIGEIIPWDKQAELAGILISDYQRQRIAQTLPIDERSRAPKGSYTGWFNNWGQRFKKAIAPDDAIKELKEDEVGGSPFEAIADYLADPSLNASGQFWDVIGYRVGSAYVPCLGRWGGRPGFYADLGDDARGHFRPLVRGSKIVTR